LFVIPVELTPVKFVVEVDETTGADCPIRLLITGIFVAKKHAFVNGIGNVTVNVVPDVTPVIIPH
jgi:hypothetical protein